MYERVITNLNLTINSTSSWVRSGIIDTSIEKILSNFIVDTIGQNFSGNAGLFSDTHEIAISLNNLIGTSERIVNLICIQYVKTTD